MSIKMKMNKLDEMELLSAIKYMYGLKGLAKARKEFKEGNFTQEEIYRAIAYYRSNGLPLNMKKEYAEKVLPDVINEYKKYF